MVYTGDARGHTAYYMDTVFYIGGYLSQFGFLYLEAAI